MPPVQNVVDSGPANFNNESRQEMAASPLYLVEVVMADAQYPFLVAYDLQVEAAVVDPQRDGVVFVRAARRAFARARHVRETQGDVQLRTK